MPRDGPTCEGRGIRRKLDSDGGFIGQSDNNPYIDTSIYEVEFPDGNIWEYNTNVIAENLYASLDEQGKTLSLFSEIINHRKDDSAITTENGWFITTSGTKR